MTSDEIRRANLIALIAEVGGVAVLSEITEKSETQISQWKNASLDSRTRKPRGISDEVCRHMEICCRKERGWMDNLHEKVTQNAEVVSADKLIQVINNYEMLDSGQREDLLDFMSAQLSRRDGGAATADNQL